MEGDRPDSLLMESEGGIRLISEIQIEPVELSVIRTSDEIVPSRMEVKARVPLHSRNQFFHHRLGQTKVYLSLQVEHPHGLLGGYEYDRLQVMEQDLLNVAFRFHERPL